MGRSNHTVLLLLHPINIIFHDRINSTVVYGNNVRGLGHFFHGKDKAGEGACCTDRHRLITIDRVAEEEEEEETGNSQ